MKINMITRLTIVRIVFHEKKHKFGFLMRIDARSSSNYFQAFSQKRLVQVKTKEPGLWFLNNSIKISDRRTKVNDVIGFK